MDNKPNEIRSCSQPPLRAICDIAPKDGRCSPSTSDFVPSTYSPRDEKSDTMSFVKPSSKPSSKRVLRFAGQQLTSSPSTRGWQTPYRHVGTGYRAYQALARFQGKLRWSSRRTVFYVIGRSKTTWRLPEIATAVAVSVESGGNALGCATG